MVMLDPKSNARKLKVMLNPKKAIRRFIMRMFDYFDGKDVTIYAYQQAKETIINLTNENVVLVKKGLPNVTIPCETTPEIKEIGTGIVVEVVKRELPEERPNTYYIVDKVIATTYSNRKDLLVTGKPVYNDCKQFVGYANLINYK